MAVRSSRVLVSRTLSSTLRAIEAPSAALSTRPSASRLFVGWWLPVLAYVATIFVLSSQPGLTSPVNFQNSDKVLHLLEYGGLGFFLGRALRASLGWPLGAPSSLLVVAIGMAIGAGDEWWQSHVPGRDSTILDWCADSAGLVLAQILKLVFEQDGGPRR